MHILCSKETLLLDISPTPYTSFLSCSVSVASNMTGMWNVAPIELHTTKFSNEILLSPPRVCMWSTC